MSEGDQREDGWLSAAAPGVSPKPPTSPVTQTVWIRSALSVLSIDPTCPPHSLPFRFSDHKLRWDKSDVTFLVLFQLNLNVPRWNFYSCTWKWKLLDFWGGLFFRCSAQWETPAASHWCFNDVLTNIYSLLWRFLWENATIKQTKVQLLVSAFV